MKKVVSLISMSLLLLGCKNRKEINISALNGYWEIEKVIAPTGEEKNYKLNAFVDFFKIETDSTGYRVKIKPNFIGAYEGNNIKQQFKITHINEAHTIIYKVKNTTWSETLIEATPNRLITKNNEGVSYIYKPFTPITVE